MSDTVFIKNRNPFNILITGFNGCARRFLTILFSEDCNGQILAMFKDFGYLASLPNPILKLFASIT